MEYNYNGKVYKVDDNRVDELMESLDISLADACETILADDGVIDNEEQNALDKDAKKTGRRYEKSEKTRKKVKKERKVDENKAELLKIIANALENEANIVQIAQKNEVELSFSYENDNYTVKLTKHRPKKA